MSNTMRMNKGFRQTASAYLYMLIFFLYFSRDLHTSDWTCPVVLWFRFYLLILYKYLVTLYPIIMIHLIDDFLFDQMNNELYLAHLKTLYDEMNPTFSTLPAQFKNNNNNKRCAYMQKNRFFIHWLVFEGVSLEFKIKLTSRNVCVKMISGRLLNRN